MTRFTGLAGLVVLLSLAVVCSNNRRRISWRLVLAGVGLQFLLAVLIHRVGGIRTGFEWVARVVTTVLGFTDAGARYIFGPLFDSASLGQALYGNPSFGFVFAIRVLPTIIFFSSLMSVLYHLGIMQRVVQVMAWAMRRTLGVSGAESLAVAADIFVGQTESPLVIRPFVSKMTQSELMAMMTGGFATIAGGVMGAYVVMLGGEDDALQVHFAKHLLCASIMSAPAAFVMAKIMVPETEESLTAGTVRVSVERETVNVIDAASRGAGDGLKLALNVGAMLLAFMALIAMCDYPLGKLGEWKPVADFLARHEIERLSITTVLGWIFSPLAWAMGVPGGDASKFGSLLGTQIVMTEFVAYRELARIQSDLHPHTVMMATYALCGFANFGSIAIQIGGTGGIAPDRRADLARLGLRAMFGGAMATWMTSTIAGMLVTG